MARGWACRGLHGGGPRVPLGFLYGRISGLIKEEVVAVVVGSPC